MRKPTKKEQVVIQLLEELDYETLYKIGLISHCTWYTRGNVGKVFYRLLREKQPNLTQQEFDKLREKVDSELKNFEIPAYLKTPLKL